MRVLVFFGLLALAGGLASCATPFGEAPGTDGGSNQTNGDAASNGEVLDGGVVDPGPTFSFVQATSPVYVQQGQVTIVSINIKRGITPGTDIPILVTSEPDGVFAVSPTIPAGSSTGQLAITVDASTPQGALNDVLALQGTAKGASITVTTNLKLFVISGKPGSLDTTSASDAIIENQVDYYTIRATTPQNDGKILIGAMNTDYATSQPTSAVIRLNADGSVDSTLSGANIKNIPGAISAVTAYPDGRIVTTTSNVNISRYTAAGVPDTKFNTTGSVVMDSSPPIPAGWTSFDSFTVAVGQNDSIYAGGRANNGSGIYPYAFLQLPATGQGSIPICSGSWDSSNSISYLSLLPTGALAFVGSSVSRGVGVGRYKEPSSCALDESYGTNGTWYSTDWQILSDALFETDGSVDLLVGNRSTRAYSLVRLDPNGNPTAYEDILSGSMGGSNGITRAPDGRYLVAGQHESGGNAFMDVAYYNSDLKPDMSIGNQGIVTIPVFSTVLTNPTGIGLRAVYTLDGSRTMVVGSISGINAAGTNVEHLVVARIWN
ncbi:MAG: hypothetical protein FWD73_11800 [Polyangiaceae bacterium]|nr:hypothetical protein [Polyangiaceae bacterium]